MAEVPNAPCGVESYELEMDARIQFRFLMHRVELKAGRHFREVIAMAEVPNAPCGVERLIYGEFLVKQKLFLMHRVELKGLIRKSCQSSLV